jgi:hypothetical protein
MPDQTFRLRLALLGLDRAGAAETLQLKNTTYLYHKLGRPLRLTLEEILALCHRLQIAPVELFPLLARVPPAEVAEHLYCAADAGAGGHFDILRQLKQADSLVGL